MYKFGTFLMTKTTTEVTQYRQLGVKYIQYNANEGPLLAELFHYYIL